MKPIKLYMLFFIIPFLFIGCSKNEQTPEKRTIELKVLKKDIETEDILALSLDNSTEQLVGETTLINMSNVNIVSQSGDELSIDSIEPSVRITVMFDGTVNETYPTRLNNVEWVQVNEG